MTYDLNGNLATLADAGGTTTYTWNPRNQLTSLSGPGLSASFGYDALGRRWTKTVNAAQTDFLHDGLNPVQEGVLPATPAANLLTGLGLDEFFTRTDAAGLRALLADALGSTVALADGSGAVQTEYTYAPFGETSVTGAANTNPYRYTGREDDGAGIYYYRARYYSPGLGRFLSEDRLSRLIPGFCSPATVGRLWGPPVIDTYVYARNNPVSFIDPEGGQPRPRFQIVCPSCAPSDNPDPIHCTLLRQTIVNRPFPDDADLPMTKAPGFRQACTWLCCDSRGAACNEVTTYKQCDRLPIF